MPRTVSQARPTSDRSAPRHSNTASAHDYNLVLDCLRVRDLGGDWLGHDSFDRGAHNDEVRHALVRDGLAVWDELGIHITPAGRRAWAEQRRAVCYFEASGPMSEAEFQAVEVANVLASAQVVA